MIKISYLPHIEEHYYYCFECSLSARIVSSCDSDQCSMNVLSHKLWSRHSNGCHPSSGTVPSRLLYEIQTTPAEGATSHALCFCLIRLLYGCFTWPLLCDRDIEAFARVVWILKIQRKKCILKLNAALRDLVHYIPLNCEESISCVFLPRPMRHNQIIRRSIHNWVTTTLTVIRTTAKYWQCHHAPRDMLQSGAA